MLLLRVSCRYLLLPIVIYWRLFSHAVPSCYLLLLVVTHYCYVTAIIIIVHYYCYLTSSVSACHLHGNCRCRVMYEAGDCTSIASPAIRCASFDWTSHTSQHMSPYISANLSVHVLLHTSMHRSMQCTLLSTVQTQMSTHMFIPFRSHFKGLIWWWHTGFRILMVLHKTLCDKVGPHVCMHVRTHVNAHVYTCVSTHVFTHTGQILYGCTDGTVFCCEIGLTSLCNCY